MRPLAPPNMLVQEIPYFRLPLSPGNTAIRLTWLTHATATT
jgi:hypothetical protein